MPCIIYMYAHIRQVYWYISQISGERLQDHWSSGCRTFTTFGLQKADMVIFFSLCFNKREICLILKNGVLKYEPHREKTAILPIRKQRRRSASQ